MSRRSESKTEAAVPGQVQRLAVFGPPLLLAGEDAAAYDELLARMCAAVKPVDVIDEMLIADVVALECEVRRWRRSNTTLMQELVLEGLERFLIAQLESNYALHEEHFKSYLTEILKDNLPPEQVDSAEMLAAECAPNTKEAHDKLVQVLSSIGLKRDTVLNDARADKAKELVDEYVQGEREAVTLVNELLSDAGVSMNSVMIRALSDRIDEIERFDRLTAIAETRRNAALREIDRRRAVLGETLRLQRSRDRGRRLRGRRVSARAAASRRENRGVTSERKITANRANARASTGPRTAQGRTRAVRNALRHALSLPVCSTPALSEEVEVLASNIAGPGANAETQELARRVAEAQIDVHRVRSARHQFLSDTLSEEYESYASMRTKGKLLRALLRPIRRTYQWKP